VTESTYTAIMDFTAVLNINIQLGCIRPNFTSWHERKFLNFFGLWNINGLTTQTQCSLFNTLIMP